MVYPDARINLGYALLQQGKKNDAWAAFQPAYEEVLRDHVKFGHLADNWLKLRRFYLDAASNHETVIVTPS